MPRLLGAWYSFYDLTELADRGVVMSGEFRPGELPRLDALVSASSGRRIEAQLNFYRDAAGFVGIDLLCEGRLGLVCQRCLEVVDHELREEVRWTVVESELQAAAVPADREVLVLGSERFLPAALVEDEIIVALPIVPRHLSIDDCGPLAQNLVALSPGDDSELGRPQVRGH